MKHLNCVKVGLATGVVMGLWHVLWCCFVVMGIAHDLLTWILGLHFLNNPYHVTEFSVMRAAGLVVVATSVGFLFGYCFAMVWNWLTKPEQA